MKRPFAVIGFSMLAASVAAVFIGKEVSGFTALAGAVCFAILFAVKKQTLLKEYTVLSMSFLSAALAFFLFFAVSAAAENKVEPFRDKKAEITGQIQEYSEYRYEKYYYAVKVYEVEGRRVDSFKIRLSSSKPLVVEPYDVIQGEVQFFSYEEGFGFSTDGRYAAKGVSMGAYASGFGMKVYPSEKKPLIFYFKRLRKELDKQIYIMLPKREASVLSAMLLGTQNELDEKTISDFRNSGITHILVISGMHTAMISAVLLWILKRLKLKRVPRNMITIAAIIFFMLLTGLLPTVMRCGITMIIFLLADMFGRENDGINSLGFAAAVMCAANPRIGSDIGFLMSVLATIGILEVYPKVMASMAKIGGILSGKKAWIMKIIKALVLSVSATVMILPLQVYLFGTVSLASPLVTVILTYPTALLMYLGVIMLMLSGFSILTPIAEFAAVFAGGCTKLICKTAEIFGNISFLTVEARHGYALLSLSIILAIITLLIWMKRSIKLNVTALAMSVLIFAGALHIPKIAYRDIITIAVADAGDDSCVILAENSKAVVLAANSFDTSAAQKLLNQAGVKNVQAVFFLEDGRKPAETVQKVIAEYPTEKIFIPKDFYLEKHVREAIENVEIEKIEESGEFSFSDRINIEYDEKGNFIIKIDKNSICVIEKDGANVQNADFLITNNVNYDIYSAFTVLQSNDIMIEEVVKKSKRRQSYIFAAHQSALFIDIDKDGKYSVRREL